MFVVNTRGIGRIAHIVGQISEVWTGFLAMHVNYSTYMVIVAVAAAAAEVVLVVFIASRLVC